MLKIESKYKYFNGEAIGFGYNIFLISISRASYNLKFHGMMHLVEESRSDLIRAVCKFNFY